MTVFQSLLNNDFAVSRRQRTPDAQGGWVISYASITPIRGRLRPASSAEIISAQQEQRKITHVFYCVEGEDIARGDQISGDGVTVDIMALREPSRADHHLEIDCLEKQAETSEDGGS
ncbi:MAG: phage head closure protein [Anaerolineales bacterium]|nr:phage head closure protein [Anaerolineales bacterium]